LRLGDTSRERTLTINRILRQSSRKSALEEVLELAQPDGTTLTGDPAGEALEGLLQSSFRDFLTTVYQHQEAIRAVLTQEPKDRNDAIDRLLGLSDQRNLLGALDSADLRGRQREIARDFTSFEEQIQAGLAARENDLVALRQEAKEAGLARSRLNGKAALAAAGKTADSLRAFAAEAELDLPELNVPEEWPGLAEFEKSTKKAVSQLRSQVPGIEEQKKLIRRQQQLLTAKTAWESLRQRWTDLGAQTRTLDKEHADRKAVDAKIADATEKLEAQQDQLRQTNGRAAVVHEAVGFLDSLDDPEPPCPVCESVVPNLAEKLKDLWASKLKNLVENITAKINSFKAQLKELRGTASQYQRLNDQAELLKEEQASLQAKTADLLAVEIQDDDDPLAMIVAEQDQLATRLQQLGQAIQGRQDRLDAIEHDLDLVRLARDYLHHEQKKQVLETIQESDAFKKLEVIRDQIAQLVEDAEAIKNAVAEVTREEAETKLTAAGETIDQYFRQLSRNPAVRQLKLTITADKRNPSQQLRHHRPRWQRPDADTKPRRYERAGAGNFPRLGRDCEGNRAVWVSHAR
jgi:DNA repair exonuclease SbcCD ATPase subunit